MSPDTQRHRGAHPADRRLFAESQWPALCAATAELSWLLTRGYPIHASLKLVGDRHGLGERQRIAVSRAACSDTSRAKRRAACLPLESLQGEPVMVDGFNLLITVEAALSGGVILECRDGCLRDLASVHGSYRHVQETEPALCLLGETLQAFAPVEVTWLLDRPISNSGRLALQIRALAAQREWPWSVETVFNPDPLLLASENIVLTSDSAILDGVKRWADLNGYLIPRQALQAWRIDLSE